jgi:hypothetical protein
MNPGKRGQKSEMVGACWDDPHDAGPRASHQISRDVKALNGSRDRSPRLCDVETQLFSFVLSKTRESIFGHRVA